MSQRGELFSAGGRRAACPAGDGSDWGIRNRVRVLRLRRGWTQAELARRVGVDRAYINRVERNRQQPGRRTMVKLAEVFSCSLDDMFYFVQRRDD